MQKNSEVEMNEYIPSPNKWVADQVELYEGSGGTEGTTLGSRHGAGGWEGLPVIIVTNRGWKTGAIRKAPLLKVKDGNSYILVASQGGAAEHPLWYHNLKAEPDVIIRDGTKVYSMNVIEVEDADERMRLWKIAVTAYPPYEDYQQKTARKIPVFVARPMEEKDSLA